MNGKLDIAEEKISELDISIGTIQNEMEEKKNMSELWNNFKQPGIWLIKVPAGGRGGEYKKYLSKSCPKKFQTF